MAKAKGRSRWTEARQRVRLITRLAAALAALGLLAASCARDEPRESTAPGSAQRGAQSDAVVWARVDGKAITATEVDESLRLPLHDLDQVRYQLRARRLEEILQSG